MKNQHLKYLALAAIVLVASDAAVAATAAATPSVIAGSHQSIGDVAGLNKSLIAGDFAVVLFTVACYVIAFIFGCIGLWQLNARSKKPVKTPLKEPIAFLVVAVLLVGFPEFLGSGYGTPFFSESAQDYTPKIDEETGYFANNITNSLQDVAAVVTAVCYVIAFIFGSIALWQLNAHDKKPTKTSQRAPIIYLTIAVLFGGFPEFLGTDTNCGVWGCGPHDNWTPNSQIMGQSPIIGEAPRVQTHAIQD